MTDAEVAAEVQAIKERLAVLAAEPQRPDIAAEIGAIRAQLRQLAASNEAVGERLANVLGLRPGD